MRIGWGIAAAVLGLLGAVPAEAAEGACRTAEAYVAGVNERDAKAVAELFAPAAEFRTPYGAVLHSRAEVEAFYGRLLTTSRAGVRASSYADAGTVCTFELEAEMRPDGQGGFVAEPGHPYLPTSVDIATVGPDGRILRMVAYPAPRSRWQAGAESSVAPGGGRLP
jgi:hypothetical protein